MNGRNSSTLKTGKFFVLKFCRADIPAYFKRRNNKNEFFILRRAGFGHLLLIDSVLFSKSIPSGNKKELLEKLKELSNKYFKFSAANIQSYDSADRRSTRSFFTPSRCWTRQFQRAEGQIFYNEYGADKKLRHRLNEAGEARNMS